MPSAKISFLMRVKLPYSLYRAIGRDGQEYLSNLSREKHLKVNEVEFLFEAADMLRVKKIFDEADIEVSFPKAKTIKQWGLAYSGKGDSIKIMKENDAFVVITKKIGEEEKAHLIPEKRVWRVFYIIKQEMEQKKTDVLKSREIWEAIIRNFEMDYYMDSEYGLINTDAFFGNRKTYYNFFYYPIKILQEIGKVEYEKSGIVHILKKEVKE